MKNPRDVKSIELEFSAPEAAEIDEPIVTTVISRLPAGCIVHDARGNALWKWQGDTSSTDTVPGVLESIDPTDLEVEELTGESGLWAMTKARDAGGGYDPYNTDSTPGKRSRAKG
jgi:hypothetical protein